MRAMKNQTELEGKLGVKRDGDWVQFQIPFRCAILDGDKTIHVSHYAWQSAPIRVVGKIETDDGPIYFIERKDAV